MIQAVNISLQFGGRILFKDVNLKFTKGNCYGIIGANGSGKSTFLKILTGEIEQNKGEIIIDEKERMSVLEQNQNKYDENTVLETVLLGHKRITEISKLKEELYQKENFTEADGNLAAELETEYAELGGWESDSQAKVLLAGIGIPESLFETKMKDIDPKKKVKVLIAQALFLNPDILILDEPTNNLDFKSTRWLENYLLDFENTVIIVSHNRHFLNKVCTHVCDVDFGQINMYLGNYDFWYETSQLMARQSKDLNKKNEQRAKELKDFIARFSANASKSKQATSRKKELEKLTINDFKPSSRKYPFIDFKYEQEIGKEILNVKNLTKKGLFKNLSFTLSREDKMVILASNSLVPTTLFNILMGLDKADSGSVNWGKTIKASYLPQDNRKFFEKCGLSLVDWLRQYSKDQTETFIRGWLGRMLFSGEEALKQASVLSGGEKVRCMMAKMMLEGGNFLLLDEPTNHLDLESITALNKGMQNFKGTMIFTSHDQEIVETVSNRILDIVDENTFIDKQMTYEEYNNLKL
ncbi:MAG: ABC-F family ATP-binding cassette domain-containing protein [Clostridia bacterium]|nr:ABC-F family ATP-binding cassette domain-containing protein [Clostridia bacterium]